MPRQGGGDNVTCGVLPLFSEHAGRVAILTACPVRLCFEAFITCANYLRRFLQDDEWDALGGASDATPAPAAPVCTLYTMCYGSTHPLTAGSINDVDPSTPPKYS